MIVGDRARIEPAVRELNLGAVHLVDADGSPYHVVSSEQPPAPVIVRFFQRREPNVVPKRVILSPAGAIQHGAGCPRRS